MKYQFWSFPEKHHIGQDFAGSAFNELVWIATSTTTKNHFWGKKRQSRTGSRKRFGHCREKPHDGLYVEEEHSYQSFPHVHSYWTHNTPLTDHHTYTHTHNRHMPSLTHGDEQHMCAILCMYKHMQAISCPLLMRLLSQCCLLEQSTDVLSKCFIHTRAKFPKWCNTHFCADINISRRRQNIFAR